VCNQYRVLRLQQAFDTPDQFLAFAGGVFRLYRAARQWKHLRAG
jgi:hypothetical protein